MGLSTNDDEGLWAAMVQEILDDEDASFDARMKIAERIFHVRALSYACSSFGCWVSYNTCICCVCQKLSALSRAKSFVQNVESTALQNIIVRHSDLRRCVLHIACQTMLPQDCISRIAECSNCVDFVPSLVVMVIAVITSSRRSCEMTPKTYRAIKLERAM